MDRMTIRGQNVLKLALPVLLFLGACGGDDNNGGGGGGTPSNPPPPAIAYVANQTSNNVSAFMINGPGALVPVAGSPFPVGTNPGGVALSSDGTLAFVANQGSNSVSAFTVNTTTGALTPVGGSPFAAGTTPFRL